MSNELVVSNPAELMRQSTDVAGVCKDIVLKTAVPIQGKKYVKVEGWQAIAIAHGCILSSKDVERTETGFKAIGEVHRGADGQLLATAEGFVGQDEYTWFGGTDPKTGKTYPARSEYAIRAMAQTRAMSRAARTAFAHVVVMMDAGLSTTPAEEVPEGGFDNGHSEKDDKKPKSKNATAEPPAKKKGNFDKALEAINKAATEEDVAKYEKLAEERSWSEEEYAMLMQTIQERYDFLNAEKKVKELFDDSKIPM